jgi:hypothetical protein
VISPGYKTGDQEVRRNSHEAKTLLIFWSPVRNTNVGNPRSGFEPPRRTA